MSRLRDKLQQSLRSELARSRFVIPWGGALGALAHPVYWLIWTYVLPQPYDNLPLRLSAALLCVPLILQRYWPKRFEAHLLAYWHFCLIYVMPFVCSFLAVKNNFSTMWMMTEVMMIFIMALCIDSPLLLMVYIIAGILAGSLVAISTMAAPLILTPANKANLTLLPFVILCGMAFSRAIQKGRIFVEKNKALQAIAGSIAHEMRNPLGQIQYSLENIDRNLPTPSTSQATQALPEQKVRELYRHLAQGRLAIKRGLQVIAMTLDQVNEKTIDPASFTYMHAGEVTRKAIDEYGFESDAVRHKVQLQVIRDFPFMGDETTYLFIIFNLIKNAVHYFPLYPDANLVLTVDRDCVTVCDTGPGIAKQALPNLFEPFRTAGKADGTGLGLAYCRRAMRAFGGDIACDSVFGHYTKFTLRLPALTPATAAAEARKQAARTQMELAFQNRDGFAEPPATPRQPVLTGKTVLLADDDAFSRMLVRAYLQQQDMHVVEVVHGQAALDYLASGAPCDVLIMDIKMPGLDGLTTSTAIRSAGSRCKDLPIIILSGYSSESTLQSALAAGVNAVLAKPVEAALLHEKLAQQFSPRPTTSARPALPPAADGPPSLPGQPGLLDDKRLDELRRLDMLDEFLSDYLALINPLLTRLEISVAAQNFDDMHQALHSLLGISGTIGGSALHHLVRRLYAAVDGGHWPHEENWLKQIKVLSARTIYALQSAYVTSQAPPMSRNDNTFFSDGGTPEKRKNLR